MLRGYKRQPATGTGAKVDRPLQFARDVRALFDAEFLEIPLRGYAHTDVRVHVFPKEKLLLILQFGIGQCAVPHEHRSEVAFEIEVGDAVFVASADRRWSATASLV